MSIGSDDIEIEIQNLVGKEWRKSLWRWPLGYSSSGREDRFVKTGGRGNKYVLFPSMESNKRFRKKIRI